MTIDPRTPVIIGVAQCSQKPPVDDELINAPDPIDMMAAAIRGAGVDTIATNSPVDAIDTIAVVGGLWRYRNPAALVADELGLTDVSTILTTFGGNLPIVAAHSLASRIAAGEIEVAALVGGECTLSRHNLAKRGEAPRRRTDTRVDDVEHWGPPLDMGDLIAAERGGETPRNSYAILDSAIRASRGESLDEARDRAARLWARYAAVAATNPHAADQRGLDEAGIRNPSADNRMVSWPYTKAMCANNKVDHAGAVIIASCAAADRLGVPESQRVYPHLCVTASDTTSLLERETVRAAPGLDAAAAKLRETIGPVEAVEHLDLYSCFPSIVTLTTNALDVDSTRTLTTTGGLAFAGAPLNFAAGEGLIGMVAELRADPGSRGVVQGNGGHATKHAFGVYSTAPPESPHHTIDLGPFGSPARIAPEDHVGDGVIDGLTVEYDHDGPTRAIAIVSYHDGSRSWATSTDPDLMARFVREECVGADVSVTAGDMRAV